MVGSHPEIACLITGYIAHQNMGWARNINAHVCKIRTGIGPFSGFRLIHVIGITYRNPETTYTIIESIGAIITGSFMVSKEGIVPENLLFLSVDTADCTITIGNERIAVNLGYFTDISLFQTARLSLFGKFKKVGIFCFGIMKVESLSVDSYPHVLILIYQEFIRRSLHMDVFEPFFRFAVKLLFIIFVDAVTHRGMHPDISIIVLLKFIYRIVRQRLIISVAIIESFHTEAVKAAQSRLGTEPDVASGVLEDGTHLTVRKSIMIGEAAEFYVLIGSPCPTRLHKQQEQKQHDGMFQVVLFFYHHNRRLNLQFYKIGIISIIGFISRLFFQNFRVFSVSSVPLSCRFFHLH